MDRCVGCAIVNDDTDTENDNAQSTHSVWRTLSEIALD